MSEESEQAWGNFTLWIVVRRGEWGMVFEVGTNLGQWAACAKAKSFELLKRLKKVTWLDFCFKQILWHCSITSDFEFLIYCAWWPDNKCLRIVR